MFSGEKMSPIKMSRKIILTLNLSVLIILSFVYFNQPIIKCEIPVQSMYLPLLFNTILSILSCCSIIVYNFIFKQKEFYIFILFYVNISIELVVRSALVLSGHNQVLILMWSLLFRGILLVLLILRGYKKFQKVINFLYNRIIIFCIISLTAIVMDFKRIFYDEFLLENVQNASIVLIILMFISIVNYIVESSKNKNLMSAFINLSLIFMLFRFMYQMSHMIFGVSGYKGQNVLVGEAMLFMSLIIILLSIFIQFLENVFSLKKTRETLNIFYRIVNDSQYNKVYIYQDNKMVYANEKGLEKDRLDAKDLNDLKYKIENLFPQEQVYYMTKKTAECSEFCTTLEDSEKKKHSVTYQKIMPINNSKKDKCIHVYIARDITDEIKKENLMEINKNKLDLINKNVDEIIILTDESFKINYINSYGEKVLGFDDTDILDKAIINYILDENGNKVNGKVKKGEINKRYKCKILTYSGEYRDFTIKLEELQDKNKVVIGYVFVAALIDIDLENTLQKLNTQVKQIEQENIINKEIFANLSHELRTPIHILYSSIQLLNKQRNISNDDEFKEYYDKYELVMRQNSMRMLKLVNNIIDISKIESGFATVDISMRNIVSLVEEITLSVVPYVKIKNIDLVFDTEEEERFIKCDPEKIERILLNLLSNAIKFTPEGGEISVNIRFNTEWVMISVRDTGVGIPKEMHDVIFGRFIQVETNKDKKKGSGIGLSLVKSLVELQGGEVTINPDVESGTEFEVYLPNSTEEENLQAQINLCSVDETLVSNLGVEFSDIE